MSASANCTNFVKDIVLDDMFYGQLQTQTQKRYDTDLEALSVNNGRTGLVVFLLADPHLLEGGQGGEDGSTDPDGVFALGWCDDLDLHRRWCESGDFFLHAVSNAREHGGTSGKDGVCVQIFTDVDVALHDAVVRGLVNAAGFHAEEAWLEHCLRATESLVTDCDDLTVWEFIALLE